MPDDRERPRDEALPGDGPDLAATGQFSPFADEAQPVERPRSGEVPPAPVERTARMQAVPGAQDADATQVVPAAGDATQVAPGAGRLDATSVMPPLDRPDAGRSEAAARAAAGRIESDDVWTARAQVRTPRPGQGGDFTATDWVPAPAEPQRPWWLPILVGVLVLTLLALLGVGVWLITRGAGDEDPVTPVTVPAPTAPATERPTTTKPTPSRTTAEPTEAEPADVEVPLLVGRSSADARRALDRVGLAYRLVFRSSNAVPSGTVIASDPEEGSEVSPDTEVALVIARAAEPSPSSTSPTPGRTEESSDGY